MQTTLRINDEVYREAKAQAAREGVSLTRYLEAALRAKLDRKQASPAPAPHPFRVYAPEHPRGLSNKEIRRIADEEQEKQDAMGLGQRV